MWLVSGLVTSPLHVTFGGSGGTMTTASLYMLVLVHSP